MLSFSEVLAGVPVRRGIAAADVAANLAEAQMDPGIAHPQALLAPVGVRGRVLYLLQVGTGLLHRLSLHWCRGWCLGRLASLVV